MSDSTNRKLSSPFPTRLEEMQSMRKTAPSRSLNDYIDDIHNVLWNKPGYRESLEAVFNSEAIEGSQDADDFIAATMIRTYAGEMKIAPVKDKKLDTITKSLHVVVNRYGMGRPQRRRLVKGVVVPQNGTGTNHE